MKTSRTIKAGQRKPPTILKAGDNSWKVAGRTRPFYWVTRNKTAWYCSCPAKRLCRHITAVVKDLAGHGGYDVVQVWTDESDARRQKRAVTRMKAHGRPFWVTLACRWAESPAGTRFAGIRRDKWNDGLFDVYFWKGGYRGRMPARRQQ